MMKGKRGRGGGGGEGKKRSEKKGRRRTNEGMDEWMNGIDDGRMG